MTLVSVLFDFLWSYIQFGLVQISSVRFRWATCLNFYFFLFWVDSLGRIGLVFKPKPNWATINWCDSVRFDFSCRFFGRFGSVFGWPSEFWFGSIRFRAKIDPNRAIFCPSSHCLTNEMLGWAMRKYFWVNKNALLWIDLFTLSFQINFQRKRLPTFERKKANLFECSSYSRVVWRISSTIWPTSSAIMLTSSVAFSTISGVFPTSLTTSSVGLSGFRWVLGVLLRSKAQGISVLDLSQSSKIRVCVNYLNWNIW